MLRSGWLGFARNKLRPKRLGFKQQLTSFTVMWLRDGAGLRWAALMGLAGPGCVSVVRGPSRASLGSESSSVRPLALQPGPPPRWSQGSNCSERERGGPRAARVSTCIVFALLPLAKAGHTTEADGPCKRWGYRDSEQTRGLTRTTRHVEGIQNFPRSSEPELQVVFPLWPDISIPFRKHPGAALCWDVDVVILLDSHLLSGASDSRSS